MKKPEKTEAEKAEEARKLAEEKAERERREAEEAARKRVAGAFGKGAQMGNKGKQMEPVYREVRLEICRMVQLREPVAMEHLTWEAVRWGMVDFPGLCTMCRMRERW